MKTRVISAIVVLAIFIPLLIIGGALFNIFVTIVALLGLKELIDIRESKDPLPLTIKVVAFLLFGYFVLSNSVLENASYLLDYRLLSLLIITLLLPILIYNDNKVYNINDAMFLIGSIVFLGLAFNLFISIRELNIMYIIYLLLITTMSDNYAFFGGSLIGKHKMIPKISPGKTWEGLAVGTIFGVLISGVFYYIAINDSVNLVNLILCTTALSILGQLGDFVFSSIKRLYDKKDFSNLMPGHGGVLDRLDSFIFVVLGYMLVMYII